MQRDIFAKMIETGTAKLLDYSENYVAAKPLSMMPLKSADIDGLVSEVERRIDQHRLLLPDRDVLIRRIVVAALNGHLVLAGPPGTGKTTLARIIAESFNCTSTVETATADWSVYDVIGGLRPRLVGASDLAVEVLEPWLGHVTRAAIECANTMARHDENPSEAPNQAHWLIVDEFNRAEIDKAIGPLYTSLSDNSNAIRLWFSDAPERSEVWLPGRFRIVGTMNSVDTAYVLSFSQGLTRRFQFIHVGVPEKDQIDEELRLIAHQASDWYDQMYGSALPADGEQVHGDPDQFLDSDRLAETVDVLRQFLSAVRYPDSSRSQPDWPLGSAQVADVLKQVRLCHETEIPSMEVLDLAIADRIVPQMGELTGDHLEAIGTILDDASLADLKHTRRALAYQRDQQRVQFI